MKVKTANWPTQNLADEVILSKGKMTSRKRYTWSSPSILRSWKLEGRNGKPRRRKFMGRLQWVSQTTPSIPPSGLQGRKSPLKYTFYSPYGQATGTQPHCPSAYRRATEKSAFQGDSGDSATLVVADTAAPYQPPRSRCWASPYCHVFKYSRSSSPLNLSVPGLHKACTLRKWHSHLTDQHSWSPEINRV